MKNNRKEVQMRNIAEFSSQELRKLTELRERLEGVQLEIQSFLTNGKAKGLNGKKHQMSPEGRARIAEAQRKRWAKLRKKTKQTTRGGQTEVLATQAA